MLYTNRAISILINIIILAIGWFAIIFVNYIEKDIEDTFEGIFLIENIAALIPSIVTSIVNMAFPAMSIFLTRFERWDFNHHKLIVAVARLYIAKMLNLAIVALLNLELYANGEYFREGNIIAFNSNLYTCRED